MQWRVDDQQAIHPFNAGDRSAHDAGGAVGISLTSQSWIITGDNNGYTYVTSTSWPHSPSSFPLVVSRITVELSGVH